MTMIVPPTEEEERVDSIGRYRLERRIGAGSFATVWLGHDDDLDVPVAVKVLAENWADNADVRSRFLAEARILRRIRDPRLVQVYDIGTVDDGRPYFVMDYINGGTFNDLRKAGCEPLRGLRLAAEACRAIEVLHANDIIHRDVTPGNLLLSNGPGGQTRVLIADLGVAKSMVDAVGATMTAGTPSYMAPEQAAGVLPLDRRADIYSLTAVTYALLTGAPPFVTRSIADILARDPDRAPEPVAERLGAPPSLDAVLVAGLAADRDRRPPTALLLAEGFETIARQMARRRPRPPGPAGRGGSAEATVITNPNRPPASAPASPPPGSLPPQPVTRSTPPSTIQPYDDPAPAVAPSYAERPTFAPIPAATAPPPPAPTTVADQPKRAPRRAASYYVLLTLAALALFALSMFVTILLLQQ
jgi:serine/threonine protein kinase